MVAHIVVTANLARSHQMPAVQSQPFVSLCRSHHEREARCVVRVWLVKVPDFLNTCETDRHRRSATTGSPGRFQSIAGFAPPTCNCLLFKTAFFVARDLKTHHPLITGKGAQFSHSICKGSGFVSAQRSLRHFAFRLQDCAFVADAFTQFTVKRFFRWSSPFLKSFKVIKVVIRINTLIGQ